MKMKAVLGCLRLAIKNADENAPTKRDLVSAEFLDGDQPTLEEIRSWGKSFDKLMKNSTGRKVFRDFLRSEFSEENILFWLACEDLKKENSAEVVEEKARLIYEDYISILSPREVSLDSRVREIVNRNMIEPTTHTFDEAQIQIYTLMHRDSYPRFLNSQKFKTLAQMQDNSNAGSKADSPT
ncbi:regulator of G-protein signaling 17 isoform X1 [Drosophila nasuta]|uniref:regulator of G-protein signaling 17 isoform X1 n=1 Tax=Drosophila nasuta TaxID=42062 RepID=UPI00295F0263|nr:regulator of G-protein signaling 17 isoform X1 [Drosophila nasuta]